MNRRLFNRLMTEHQPMPKQSRSDKTVRRESSGTLPSALAVDKGDGAPC